MALPLTLLFLYIFPTLFSLHLSPIVSALNTTADFISALKKPCHQWIRLDAGTEIFIEDLLPVLTKNITVTCATNSCTMGTTDEIPLFRADTCRARGIVIVTLLNFTSVTMGFTQEVPQTNLEYSYKTTPKRKILTFAACQDGCYKRNCGFGRCVRGSAPLEFACKCDIDAFRDPNTGICVKCPLATNCCGNIDCGPGSCQMNMALRIPVCLCYRGAVLNGQGVCRSPEDALRDDIRDPTVDAITLTQSVNLQDSLPPIVRSLNISGLPGVTPPITISGFHRHQIFNLSCVPGNKFYASYQFTVSSLTLKEGKGYQGGAIYSSNGCAASIKVVSTSIRNCTMTAPSGGSAVHVDNGAKLSFVRSRVEGNLSPPMKSAAVYFHGTGDFQQTLFRRNTGRSVLWDWAKGETNFYAFFSRCVFFDNTAMGDGGAVMVSGDPNEDLTAPLAVFEECRFMRNRAFGGGGAVATIDGFGQFTACNFTANSARLGGAIYGSLTFATRATALRMKACQFSNNSALSPAGGGAIATPSGVDICFSQFRNNYDSNKSPSDLAVPMPAVEGGNQQVQGCRSLPPYIDVAPGIDRQAIITDTECGICFF